MPSILQTNRLTVRQMNVGDAPFVAELLTDPEVMAHYVRPYSVEESVAWLHRQVDNYAKNEYGFWVAADRATSVTIGLVGITMRVVDGLARPEVGYIVHKRFWRRGFATEAALETRNYAFTHCGFDHVIALVRPTNVPAQGVASRLGMAIEKRAEFNGSEYLVYSVSRSQLRRGPDQSLPR